MNFAFLPFHNRFFILPMLFCVSVLSGQSLQITNANTAPYTPTNLISNVLLGNGVDVTSIQYNGKAEAIGYFSGGTNSIGIERGILLTTGLATSGNSFFGAEKTGIDFSSYNNNSTANDGDLDDLSSSSINNVAVYTIKFVPTSDTLRFKYCFGSEEYPEYGCDQYNDVFGFFIKGPNYANFTNIAKIPGTNLPVAINNIHPLDPDDPCAPQNVQYYNYNEGTNKQPTYDGFTDVFTAFAVVQPCQEYTIKLAIADVFDDIYDSGVFLEAKSFGTGSLQVELETVSNDGTIAEGCADGMLRFILPNEALVDYPIDYKIWGNATNGTDYQTIPLNLIIPKGQSEISIPLVALQDGIAESPETIAIDFMRDPCRRDTIYVTIRDNDLVAPMLRGDTSLCVAGAASLELNATVPIALPQPKVFTNPTDFSIVPVNTQLFSPITVSGVKPTMLDTGVIRSVCVNLTHPFDDDVDLYLFSPDGQFLELSTDNGGSGDNYTQTCFTPTAVKKINFPGPSAPASATPFTGDFAPEGVWSDILDGGHNTNGNWRLMVLDDSNGFIGSLDDWSITFEPTYKINYAWTPANAVSCANCPKTIATATQNTTYQVVATDSYGCVVKDSVKLDIEQTLGAPAVSCSDIGPNSITFAWNTVNSATGYEVNINNTGWTPTTVFQQIVDGLTPGTPVTFEVRGTSSTVFDCAPLIGEAMCSTCNLPVVGVVTQDVSCPSSTNGSLVFTPDGLNPPYTYALGNQNNQTGIFNGLAAGSYSATITDGTGCIAIKNVMVNAPAPLNITTTVAAPVSCNNSTNGSVSATVVGGVGTKTFKWNDASGQTTPTAINLPAGNYVVTVTDANNCTATSLVGLSNPAPIALAASTVDANCFGTATGTATATATGGSGAFTFVWNNGQAAQTAINLVAASYVVTATDANGCTRTGTVAVSQPTQLVANVTSQAAKCFGAADGSASVVASGGSSGYTYMWNDVQNQTTANAINLIAQNYIVTVTDQKGCSLTKSIAVSQPNAINVVAESTEALCKSTNTGTATVSAIGGVGSLSVKWNDAAAQTGLTAINLAAGNYTATVTDQNGCTNTASTVVTEPTALVANALAENTSCFGSSNGKITLSVQGGTTPYFYNWSTGQTIQNLTAKPAGSYTVTVTDENGCTAIVSKAINQPSEIVLTPTNTPVKCFGEKTGALTVQVSGGSPTYTIFWAGPNAFTNTASTINNLAAGNYVVTVTDASGCQSIKNYTVEQPLSALIADLPEIGDTICFGESNGTVIAKALGGTTPYGYVWSENGISGTTLNNLATGFYHVTVTDANNCKSVDSTFVTQSQQMFGWLKSLPPLCHNGQDGKALVEAIFYGATPADLNALNYVWSTNPPQTGIQAINLSAEGTYSVTATDAAGCTATQTVKVGNAFPIEALIDSSRNVRCFGERNGMAAVHGIGGAGNFHYLWSPNAPVQTDSIASNLGAGSYSVSVIDMNGCYIRKEVVISEPTAMKINFEAKEVRCFGEANGEAKAIVTGGTSPYFYQWYNGATTNTISGLSSGQAVLMAQDQKGCTYMDSVLVKQPPTPLRAEANKKDAVCHGSNSGEISIAGSGGRSPYRYSLDGTHWGGSSRLIGLKAGVYAPWIMDNNGCTSQLPDMEVEDRGQIELELGPDLTISLGDNTQLFAEITNATPPIEYIWSSEDSIWLSCMDCPNPFVDSLQYINTFELYIIDSAGCTAEDRIRIEVQKIRKVFVPTGFTPNGSDDPANELLKIHGQIGVKILDFRVYDRWGEVVYEAHDFLINDETIGWDGTFRGKEMDPGVFVWILEVQYTDGAKEVFKGNTTLMR